VIRSLIVATSLIIFTTALSGCTWVALTPDADGVRVTASDALDACTQVGTTKARTKVRVGFFARSEKKVAEELATLARNDAPELGGNTVVAEGPVSADGVQRFAIYDCPLASDANP
jgi:hypothetical protein